MRRCASGTRRLRGTLAAALLPVASSAPAAASDQEVFEAWTRAQAAVDAASQADGRAAAALDDALTTLRDSCDDLDEEDRRTTLLAATCHRWLAERWQERGSSEAAEAAFTAAHARYSDALGAWNPVSGQVLQQLAEIFRARGDSFRALRALERGIEMAPPVTRQEAERCRSVFETLAREPLPEACTAGLRLSPQPLFQEAPLDAARHQCARDCEVVFTSARLEDRSHYGFLVDRQRWGLGIEVGPDGHEIWIGEYRRGSLNGEAVLMSGGDDGFDEYYVGDWRDGWREGYGFYRYDDGARYWGGFREGAETGPGRYVTASGATFIGTFLASKFEGEGTWTIPGVLRYEGGWRQGQRDGHGVERYVGGLMEYRGHFEADRASGPGSVRVEGTEVFSGEVDPESGPGFGWKQLGEDRFYMGQLQNGRPEGFGLRREADGSVVTGIWDGNDRVRPWDEDLARLRASADEAATGTAEP